MNEKLSQPNGQVLELADKMDSKSIARKGVRVQLPPWPQNKLQPALLNLPVARVRGVGALHVKRLAQLGILSIRDLLRHFPSRYENFTNAKKISEVKIGEICSIAAKIKKISVRRTWKKRMLLTEAILEDESGAIRAVWFNQPFIARNIRQGATISVAGKLTRDKHGLYLSGPAYEALTNRQQSRRHASGIVPVYPETRGITSRMLRYFIQPLLPVASRAPDILPQELRLRTGLMDFQTAIQEIHFPRSQEYADRARFRFAFEDVLIIQLLFRSERLKRARTLRAPEIPAQIQLVKKFLTTLPFTLTDAQRRAAWEIMQDMARPVPMNRLLNGDVGSGKTIVATIAALQAADAGYQTAILAPTEILSRQHFAKISKTLAPFPVKIALLTSKEARSSEQGFSGIVKKQTLIENISSGETMIVIGTHAILQKSVGFGKLGLVVVDEQHRFGVGQRAALIRGSSQNNTLNNASVRENPHSNPHKSANKLSTHLLSMSATPIPRTLALGIYGDLDISALTELPKGRQKIITRIIPPASRASAHKFIRSEVEKGRQIFVICPRIDPDIHEKESAEILRESADLRIEMKAVKTEFEKLSKQVFPDLRVDMLHGKMRPDEKESVMAKFVAGGIDILVSTSVVEVGVDIPNATVIMIEGAEHFGLAQLHQFRGRVGRGTHQSYCLLFTESNSRAAKSRLLAVTESSDGFALAEKDLRLRGAGQFFGTEQSGLPDLAMKSLADLPLVELARKEAFYLLQKDPQLKTAPLLKARLEEFRREVHLE